MAEETLDTAAKILKAAEEEFMEKGYGNAKMMSIAARAGVSHSMLHYYYRSKGKLFQMIFDEKAKLIVSILEGVHDKEISFKEVISHFVMNQFDLMRKNDRFVWFMIDELIHNKENLTKIMEIVLPNMGIGKSRGTSPINVNDMLEKEVKAGNVREIKLMDLIVNIVSINVASFLFLPVLGQIMPEADINRYLDERRRSNVGFILDSIMIK